jgi:hypothetical protein
MEQHQQQGKHCSIYLATSPQAPLKFLT